MDEVDDLPDEFDEDALDGPAAPDDSDEGDLPEEGDLVDDGPPVLPPVIVIVGRPNVGKSTLLNALVGSRIAIVEPTPGVTRDRVGVLCTLADRTCEVVDTGGVGIVDRQGLEGHVESQITAAVEVADVILFVVDAREGRTPLDERVALLLRPHSDRVMLIANKVESDRVEWNLGEFQTLGYGDPMRISAQEGLYLRDLEDTLALRLPAGPTTPVRMAPPDMRLAVVGRVNAGKSTLVNALVRAERMIVSEVPGTTRDSVDIRFERDGKRLTIIDTAGIRKERSVSGSVEFYAQRRAEKAMRRADVTLLVLDSSTDTARLDRQIAGYAAEQFHPIVIVANKWDLMSREGVKSRQYLAYLEEHLSGLPYAPIVFTSGVRGRNVEKVLEVAHRLFLQASTRVSTAEVNRVIERAYTLRKPRQRQGRIGRIYYGSQVSAHPPTFTLFVNDRYLFTNDYIRYLGNRFREDLPFPEVPIRIWLKNRERSPSKNKKND
ncbi:MAG: ribosome biogenesis GTPase Der [Planctomycetota bacterium]|nr:ribosome biogenesis GTPase Der [Planctomycetota bacterium]